MEYDLEKRTGEFSVNLISLCKKVKISIINENIIKQVLRSGTSVGANYCEADDAESRKDFKHKIGICKKESRETKYWLRMIAVACEECKEEARINWKEAKELNLIFNAIINSTNKNT